MKVLAYSLALLLLLAVPALAGQAVHLGDAVSDGSLAVSDLKTLSYKQANVTITNLTDESVTVEVLGSQIRPQDSGYQRIAIAYPTDGTQITLGPNGSWSGTVYTLCRDEALRAPDIRNDYSFNVSKVDQDEIDVMKFWRDNPILPQYVVNEVIWGNQTLDSLRSTVETLKALQPPAEPTGPTVEELTSHADQPASVGDRGDSAVREDE